MRCAALVGAKLAKLALPRSADVLPVATRTPRAAHDHLRKQSPGEMEKADDVDAEVALEDVRIDVQEAAERAAHGIVDQHLHVTEIRRDGVEGAGQRLGLADVAGEARLPGSRLRERRAGPARGRASRRDTPGGEASSDGRTGSWSDARDEARTGASLGMAG